MIDFMFKNRLHSLNLFDVLIIGSMIAMFYAGSTAAILQIMIIGMVGNFLFERKEHRGKE